MSLLSSIETASESLNAGITSLEEALKKIDAKLDLAFSISQAADEALSQGSDESDKVLTAIISKTLLYQSCEENNKPQVLFDLLVLVFKLHI